MSYCRGSSDNQRSDVYCWGGLSSYNTHVCYYRPKDLEGMPQRPERLSPDTSNEEWDKFEDEDDRVFDLQIKYIAEHGREPSGLPLDGKMYVDETREEFKATLLMLQDVGYHIPQNVFDRIEREMKNE